MGVVREVLFGKVDLDTIATALVLGLRSEEVVFRAISGSASSQALADRSVVCIEVGGSGRATENNFDHHTSSPLGGGGNLSACAQALERLAQLIRYVDELDRGLRRSEVVENGGFPSLSQLVSGMLLVVKDPNQRMEKGLEILRAVLQSGIDPYGSMEEILDAVSHGRWYASAKREHDRHFEAVCKQAVWCATNNGLRLAVVETTWFGAPGALYGKGAQIVVALNPEMAKRSGSGTYRKFTVAVNNSAVEGITVFPVLEELVKLEEGWGGPDHGGICGSSVDRDSSLEMETVVNMVIKRL